MRRPWWRHRPLRPSATRYMLKWSFCINFMLKKPCLNVHNPQYKFLDWKLPPPPLLELFWKFIRFGDAILPLSGFNIVPLVIVVFNVINALLFSPFSNAIFNIISTNTSSIRGLSVSCRVFPSSPLSSSLSPSQFYYHWSTKSFCCLSLSYQVL